LRALTDFAIGEWAQLLPLQHAFKQIRNDLWLAGYKRLRPDNLESFLKEVKTLAGKNIALVVAFEQPWALDWFLRMAALNLSDATVLVFDNSRSASARDEIESVCRLRKAHYLALPMNRTRHVNRSHGMAMTWIFANIVRRIEPRMFAFLDHDLIPVKHVALSERLAEQPLFGMLGASTNSSAWQLWAGYCMFDYSTVEKVPMNFLYDFSQGLDTGGRNWRTLYHRYDWRNFRFARDAQVEVSDPMTGNRQCVQLIDDRWIHIGGIGYNDNLRSKAQFFEHLADAFDQGKSWDTL
jgi:hypothetical protein